ncbi:MULTISPECIES: DUF3572 domain-containing protein [Rhodomicrobium]|uniref:DUF3572 domain-containing protein n=1 Tax=Rhodomicrobium TaxID=1068 RepID=UPI000B4AB1B4|nr:MULTISPECIES: DUF3572 domain-containing protein [Rhodomicrobium]
MDPFSNKRRRISREDAEQLAIEALTFLAADETRFVQFLGATGTDLASIRAEAGSPEFLAGVLEFLMNDESLLLVFAGHSGIDPTSLAAARAELAPDPAAEWG